MHATHTRACPIYARSVDKGEPTWLQKPKVAQAHARAHARRAIGTRTCPARACEVVFGGRGLFGSAGHTLSLLLALDIVPSPSPPLFLSLSLPPSLEEVGRPLAPEGRGAPGDMIATMHCSIIMNSIMIIIIIIIIISIIIIRDCIMLIKCDYHYHYYY